LEVFVAQRVLELELELDAIFICPKRVWKIKSLLSFSLGQRVEMENESRATFASSFYVANLLVRTSECPASDHATPPTYHPAPS